jgi:UDP-glucuronate 4-epimerase
MLNRQPRASASRRYTGLAGANHSRLGCVVPRSHGGVRRRSVGDPISLNAALARLAAIAGRPLDVSRAARESGDVLHTAADVTRAREELGFAPATSFAPGLQAEFQWVLAGVKRRPRLAAVSARPV